MCDLRMQGTSPHGTVRIWYSANLSPLLGQTGFTAPEGSVSVKEYDMDSDGSLDGIAVMVKKPAGYDPSHNDWHCEMRDASLAVKSDPPTGKIDMCISCHSAAKSTDYLAGTTL